MNAIFNFKVHIEGDNVVVNIDVEKTKEIDINFLQQALKILSDASKKIKANAEKYAPSVKNYDGAEQETENDDAVEDDSVTDMEDGNSESLDVSPVDGPVQTQEDAEQ